MTFYWLLYIVCLTKIHFFNICNYFKRAILEFSFTKFKPNFPILFMFWTLNCQFPFEAYFYCAAIGVAWEVKLWAFSGTLLCNNFEGILCIDLSALYNLNISRRIQFKMQVINCLLSINIVCLKLTKNMFSNFNKCD